MGTGNEGLGIKSIILTITMKKINKILYYGDEMNWKQFIGAPHEFIGLIL